jgi:hypothetical protein
MNRLTRVMLALLALGFVLVPLASVTELPGEARLKRVMGAGDEMCRIVGAGDPDGPWEHGPDVPTLRDGPSAAAIGDRVVLVGGIRQFVDDYQRVRSSADVEMVDLKTKRWSDLPDLPMPLNHVNLAAVGDSLYVLGGMTDEWREGPATGRAWRLRLSARRWEPIAPMPTGRGAAGVAVVGGRIYVMGGQSGRSTLGVVESFDTRTGRWRRHADMPTRRNHLSAAAVGGRVYALGGRKEDDRGLTVFERYDPVRDRWKAMPDAPQPKAGFVMALTPRGLVAAGGEDLRSRTLFAGVFAFDTDDGRWRKLPAMKAPRHGYGGVFAANRFWVFGGSECSGFKPVRSTTSLRLQ